MPMFFCKEVAHIKIEPPRVLDLLRFHLIRPEEHLLSFELRPQLPDADNALHGLRHVKEEEITRRNAIPIALIAAIRRFRQTPDPIPKRPTPIVQIQPSLKRNYYHKNRKRVTKPFSKVLQILFHASTPITPAFEEDLASLRAIYFKLHYSKF